MNSSTAGQQIEAIVGALEEGGVRAAPIMEAIDLGRSHPESVADLAIAILGRFPKGGSFLDAALGYLPNGLWDGLVRFALATLERTGKNDAADSVIAYASLQALPALHHHLDHLFRLRPNVGTYFENWPWRESGTLDVEARVRVLEDPIATSDHREKAWKAMQETRRSAPTRAGPSEPRSPHRPPRPNPSTSLRDAYHPSLKSSPAFPAPRPSILCRCGAIRGGCP
jgi:hypothetical protein